MSTTTTTGKCAQCGVPDLGTRFCESCGAPMPAAVPPAGSAEQIPSSAAPEAPARARDSGTGWRVVAMIGVLFWAVVPDLFALAAGMSGGSPYPRAEIFSTIDVLVVAIALSTAALVGRASSSAKAVGILAAAAFAGLTVGASWAGYQEFLAWGDLLASPLLLALSWAAGRGFRPRGYAVLGIVAAVIVIRWLTGRVPTGFIGSYVIDAVLAAVLTIAVILAGIALARGTRPVAPSGPAAALAAPGPAQLLVPGSRNTAATLALVFVLVSIVVDLTWFVPALRLVNILAFPLLVTGIVLGHVGLVQTRRRGQSGRGAAIAALVIGYLLLCMVVVSLIVLAVSIATLFSGVGLPY